MFFSLILAAAATGGTPPSASQYYSRALDTMKRLAQPAYVSFDTNVTGHGLNVGKPCDNGKIAWHFGLGSQKPPVLKWHATYTSADLSETIHTDDGSVCGGTAQTFDRPTWHDAYNWIRYGMLTDASNTATPAAGASPTPSPDLKTIAEVSVISPGAYFVTDGGAQRCPSGSQGHELHLAPRLDPAKNQLRDVVIESDTARICRIRFNLVTYQSAGTGLRGDMTLDFDTVGGKWMITRGHAAVALKMIGMQLKKATIDFWYSNVQFPATPA